MKKWGVIDIFTIMFGAKCVLFLISFKLKGIQEKEKNKKLCGCLILLSRMNHRLCWKPTQNQIYNRYVCLCTAVKLNTMFISPCFR